MYDFPNVFPRILHGLGNLINFSAPVFTIIPISLSIYTLSVRVGLKFSPRIWSFRLTTWVLDRFTTNGALQ